MGGVGAERSRVRLEGGLVEEKSSGDVFGGMEG